MTRRVVHSDAYLHRASPDSRSWKRGTMPSRRPVSATPSMEICPFCDWPVPQGANVCGHCGARDARRMSVMQTIALVVSYVPFGISGAVTVAVTIADMRSATVGNSASDTVLQLLFGMVLCLPAALLTRAALRRKSTPHSKRGR
jgi:hypothetical protein